MIFIHEKRELYIDIQRYLEDEIFISIWVLLDQLWVAFKPINVLLPKSP